MLKLSECFISHPHSYVEILILNMVLGSEAFVYGGKEAFVSNEEEALMNLFSILIKQVE